MTTHTRPARPRVGFLRPSHVERAFVWLLYLALLLLVVLSILGTFYGRKGVAAPITAPMRIWADATAEPWLFGLAIAIQVTLMVVQYGARQKARDDRRWWLLYLVALAWSVYYNYQAYWEPLTALAPWYFAAPLIIAGDVLPEFLAVRRE